MGQAVLACPSIMLEYRCRLPHFQPDDAYIFLTWRLFGSRPAIRAKGLYPTPGHALWRLIEPSTTLASAHSGCAIRALPAWWRSRFGAEQA